MYKRRALQRHGAALLVIWLCCHCSSPSDPPASTDHGIPGLGTLALQLQVPDIEIDELNYSVTREGSSKRNGTFIVNNFRGSFRAVVGGLPKADNYQLVLDGLGDDIETGAKVECAGSATFAIISKQTTGVSLRLRCTDKDRMTPPPDQATPTGKRCPMIGAIRAFPGEVAVPGTTRLMAEISNLDQVGAVIYAWGSDIGVFALAASGQADYTCTQAGVANINLQITFADGERTCSKQSGSVQVICRASPGSAGTSAGAVAGSGTGGSSRAGAAGSAQSAGSSGMRATQAGRAGS